MEPAQVTLHVEGRDLAAFDIQADTQVPYRIDRRRAPPPRGPPPVRARRSRRRPTNPRPLGVALDWLELERGERRRAAHAGHALLRWRPSWRRRLRVPRLAARAPRLAVGRACRDRARHRRCGTACDVMASERILREGAPIYVVDGSAGPSSRRGGAAGRAALARGLARRRRRPRRSSCSCALAVRLVLLLHPQFYYPDVQGPRALRLAAGAPRARPPSSRTSPRTSTGTASACRSRTATGTRSPTRRCSTSCAGRWSRWPATGPRSRSPSLAAVVNSLEAWSSSASRAGCAAVRRGAGRRGGPPLLPIFIARLTLAYFPALVGHAVDAVVLLVILASPARPRTGARVIAGAALLAVALLTYTQSLLNFAVLVRAVRDRAPRRRRAPETRRRMARPRRSRARSAARSPLAVFYGRYVPIFLDMRHGIPMAGGADPAREAWRAEGRADASTRRSWSRTIPTRVRLRPAARPAQGRLAACTSSTASSLR